MARSAPKDTLTTREIEVLRLLAEGKTNAQIADALGITFLTARNHVASILGKLGVDSREEAARSWQAQQRPSARATRWAKAITTVWALKLAAGAAAVVVVTAVVAGGLMLAADNEGGDRPLSRDAFFAGSVLVDYEAAPLTFTVEGFQDAPPLDAYRLVHLTGGSWLFEQTESRDGLPSIARNQQGYLAAYDTGCYRLQDPVIYTLDVIAVVPGITFAQEAPGEPDNGELAYELLQPDGPTLLVTEDLSQLGDGIVVTRVLNEADEPVGTYTFTRLTSDALAAEERRVEELEPSDETMLEVRFGNLRTFASSSPVVTELPILRDCPQLFLGPNLPLRELDDGTWVLEDGITIDLPIDAPQDELISAGLDAARSDVPIRPGTVIIEPVRQQVGRPTDPGGATVHEPFVLEIVACEEREWFRCEEFPEFEER